LTVSGGTSPYGHWAVSSGALPPGLTLGYFSGMISGTPTTDTGSPFNFSVTVMDSAGNTSAAKPLSITILTTSPPAGPSITTSSLPGGQAAPPSSTTLAASGGTPPYNNWLVSSGALPPGLTLNSSSGIISGTPTTDIGSPFN